jgi:hypothetical protein
MKTKKRFLPAVLAAAALLLSGPADHRAEAAKPSAAVWVVNINIDPAYPGGVGTPGVRPVGASVYTDYRIAGESSCVAGDANSTGLAFVTLNRRLADDSRCSDTFASRQYELTIEDTEACHALGFSFQPTCSFATEIVSPPIVRGETAFKSKATKTHVTFYFSINDNIYRITTNAEVPMVSLTNSRTVQNTGSVTLAKHELVPNAGYVVVPGASFSLPFQIQFERVAVAQ